MEMQGEESRGNEFEEKTYRIEHDNYAWIRKRFCHTSVKAESITDIQSQRTGIQSDISEAETSYSAIEKRTIENECPNCPDRIGNERKRQKIKDTKQEINDTEKRHRIFKERN